MFRRMLPEMSEMQRLRDFIGNKPFFSLINHRSFIILTGIMVLSYAVSVLAYVSCIPEIGVDSNFRATVSRIDRDFVRDLSPQQAAELNGWTIIQIADEPIDTWPHWVQTLRELDSVRYSQVSSTAHEDESGKRWVRVVLQHDGNRKEIICRVGRVATSVILPSLLWIVLQTGLFFVGIIVFWKQPKDIGARMFYLQSLVVIGAYMGVYHWSRICSQPLLTGVYILCATLLPAVNLHFFLLFPTPKRVYFRRPGMTLTAVYGVPAIFLVLLFVSYTVVRWLSRSGGSADQISLSLRWLRDLIFTYFGVAAVWYLASVGALIHGYVRARNVMERNQVRWILIGSALAIVPFGYAIYLANWHPEEFGGGAAVWPMFAASACFTFAYAIGITRYRLLQLDQLLGSGLAYFLISGFAALIYCALVVIGMLLFGSRGPSLEQALWVGGSALVLSISLDAARTRLRNYLDRRYRRGKMQIDHILQQLGGAVEQLTDTPTVARRLLTVSAELHGYPRGAVYIKDGQTGLFQLVGEHGADTHPNELSSSSALVAALTERGLADRLTLPPSHPVRHDLAMLRGDLAVGLTHENQILGVMVLSRVVGQPPSPGDAKLLAAFAPIAAVALAGAEVRRSVESLNRELQMKVEKISEQQRRIFSLQQQLVAQSRRFPTTVNTESPPVAIPAPLSALDAMIGSSPPLQQVLDLVPKVAANISAVLLRGESGTGKELVARALHDLSPRANKPYIKVHCAALAPGILESELFGHVKGSFTGATRDKPGRFEAADGGTLFLDEIGDISADLQTKLLRVLQEKTFERVGSNEPIRVDVRLITATHQDLEKLIRDGQFRADLYYRLNVISLTLPPLRERNEDVVELAHHFLQLHAERCRKTVESIDDEAIIALRDYPWPGNIRELENAIERAVVVCEGNAITLADLSPQIMQHLVVPASSERRLDHRPERSAVRKAREARHARERAEITQALQQSGWNKAEAAMRLGIARSTLLSRMKKFGLLDSSVS
jgi:transcriptional regulator with GAF, ATPase, and Fis domain